MSVELISFSSYRQPMFTGIVREVGHVVSAEGARGGLALEIDAPGTAGEAGVGDSVSVGGVCLTAEAIDDGRIAFHAVPETLARSTLGTLTTGDSVNVEPAVRAGEALGGHYVQGHVDGIGRVRSLDSDGDGARLVVEAPSEILRYCVEKGAIAVDGVSLTIAELTGDAFSVALVPHTLDATTLSQLASGREVNLEVDVLAKYVERLLQTRGLRSTE